jgi:hypothetical protein
MELDEKRLLETIARKGVKVVTYDDFHMYRPSGKAGGHWLYSVKKILLRNGWKVHEKQRKPSWGNCGFRDSKTHFHKAASA